MTTAIQFRCDVSPYVSGCDATLASKLRASLRVVRKPATRNSQPSTCRKGTARP